MTPQPTERATVARSPCTRCALSIFFPPIVPGHYSSMTTNNATAAPLLSSSFDGTSPLVLLFVHGQVSPHIHSFVSHGPNPRDTCETAVTFSSIDRGHGPHNRGPRGGWLIIGAEGGHTSCLPSASPTRANLPQPFYTESREQERLSSSLA